MEGWTRILDNPMNTDTLPSHQPSSLTYYIKPLTFSVISQLVFWYQSGRLPSNYYLCRGTEELPDFNIPVRVHWQFLSLQVFGAIAHIGINIKIKLLGCSQVPKSGENGFSLGRFRKNISLAFVESRAISDLVSTLAGFIMFGLVAIITTAINKEGLRSDWHVMRLCIFNIYYPCLVSLALFMSYYFRHEPLRRNILREIKSCLGLPKPCYVCPI